MKLELQCPALNRAASKLPTVPVTPVAVRPVHPPISAMLKENAREAAITAAGAKEKEWKAAGVTCSIPAVYRGVTGAY